MTQIIITKQLETEIRQFLDNYWALYLEGDLQTWSTLLTDDYKNIGGTEEEIWNSKQEIMDYSSAIMGQMVGVASLRNKKTEVFSLTPYVLAHEFADMYIKIENGWVFYGKFRLSSIIQKNEKGWQVVHQHGSYPDSKAEQGETFAFDKISTENRELKDAVKRRTIELENKNHELEIEAALEKVRSSALAMNEPADMVEVCRVISDQLQLMGVTDIRNVQTAIINESKGTYLNYQYFAAYKEGVIEETDYNTHPTSFAMAQEMKKSAHTTFSGSIEGEELSTFREWRKQNNQFPDPLLDEVDSAHHYFYSIGLGGLGLTTYKPLSEEGLAIFKRFHNVFSLAYRRFTDIELALAQAREAQIEAAIERIRAQSMAMYQTSDLHKVNEEVLSQLYKLKVDGLTGVSIYLVDEYDTVTIWDLSSPGNMSIPNSYSIKYDAKKYPIMGEWVEIWKTTHEDYFVLDAPKEKLIKAVEEFKEILPEMGIKFKNAIESGSLIHQWNPVGRLSDGVLSIDLMNPPSEDTKTIVIKMAGAFNMAYQRFLDLQKAETQAREARIETALERVRSRSMTMHHTSELQGVIQTVHQELLNLNISISGGSFIAINSEIETEIHCWGSGGTADTSEEVHIPYFDKPFYTNLIKGIKTGPGFFTEEYTQAEKIEFFKFLFKHEPWSKLDFKQKNETLSSPGGYTRSCCVSQHSSIFIINHFGEKFSEADNDILKRFAKVFDQAYTRFLDLQKAEAQAREAHIEAALERTRTQSMLMQQSDEILNISAVFHQQLLQLNIPTEFSYVWLPDEQKNDHQFWASWEEDDKGNKTIKSKQVTYPLDKSESYTAACYAAWASPEPTHIQFIPPADVPAFFDVWQELLDGAKKLKARFFPQGIYYAEAYMRYGCFGINIRRELSQGEKQVLKKFSIEFERAYTRFLDLRKAEAQAKEAQIELSLERIRSHVTAMQESSELLDIVVMMRNEFVTLGHEAHYFWHMRWLPEKYEKAMTSGDGTRIGMVMTLPRHIHGDIQTVADWEKSDKPTFVLAMDAENAVDYVHKMITLGDFEIVDHNAPTLDDIRHIGGLTFVMARTTHGEIGFSLPGDVPNPPTAAVDALARFAGVFDLAYKRFEDLKTAEKDLIEIKAARQNAEKALLELKATQSQLIQSEKMASLGELTAGIAHEIQNPLNFVNNFSEVSNELIDEMKDELATGNWRLATEIADDIKQNLEKINHHGKRADAIVKGMLQHSQTSTGQKEPTDINALADEYLRLAYHGLRAKDKSFNASMKTDFDESIGNINIIPQDIGRVILNLITNAFYAVNEKEKQNINGYEPAVSLSTKKLEGKVEIKVADNGNGIPQKILDKIFQPFFTTKPTGQGTGLGLSMSYDIITKGHGGELSVKSHENEGAEFIIRLPVS